MNIFSHKNIESQSRCVSLLFACPAHKSLSSCPLCKIREQSFADRIVWLKQLIPSKMEQILNHHLECYKK